MSAGMTMTSSMADPQVSICTKPTLGSTALKALLVSPISGQDIPVKSKSLIGACQCISDTDRLEHASCKE